MKKSEEKNPQENPKDQPSQSDDNFIDIPLDFFQADTPKYGQIVILEEEIKQKTAMDFIFRCLDVVAQLEDGKPLVIGINSPGGCYRSSMMIVDFIKSLKCETVAYNMSMACSGAALVLLSCNKRYAFPNSRTMLHEVHVLETGGDVQALTEHTKEMSRMNADMIKFISKNSKLKTSLLKEKFKKEKDWYMSANEAKKHGVVSAVSADFIKYVKY